MSDEQLVQRASEIMLKLLEGQTEASPNELEHEVSVVDPALDRQVVGLAVLRLLRDGRIRLTDEYNFTGSPSVVAAPAMTA